MRRRAFCHQLQLPHWRELGPEVGVSGGSCAVNSMPLNLMGTHVPAWIACTKRVCAYRSVSAPSCGSAPATQMCERPQKASQDAA